MNLREGKQKYFLGGEVRAMFIWSIIFLCNCYDTQERTEICISNGWQN